MATDISKTVIANLALSNIHAKSSVENIESDISTEAKKSNLWYDVARRQALAAADWSFAHTRLTLAAHSEDPPTNWAYRYQYPEDCIINGFRFIENIAGPNAPPIPYKIERASSDGTLSILTNTSEAVGSYTMDLEDATLFSPDFIIALSFLLGYYLCGTTTGKKELKTEMMTNYQNQVNIAMSQNLNEQAQDKPPEAPWMDGDVR